MCQSISASPPGGLRGPLSAHFGSCFLLLLLELMCRYILVAARFSTPASAFVGFPTAAQSTFSIVLACIWLVLQVISRWYMPRHLFSLLALRAGIGAGCLTVSSHFSCSVINLTSFFINVSQSVRRLRHHQSQHRVLLCQQSGCAPAKLTLIPRGPSQFAAKYSLSSHFI